ncbi:hypothetical protein QFC24_006987 [Naganishia onofrii]|uniref:Uncharacterized protein n=1 Tax=Naganishia onofrii TaxID=1851511 RepID=A0ACC2WUS1_9TREE|nr:hypothetical protein QFC24_006987 [Naganishia onofrii]
MVSAATLALSFLLQSLRPSAFTPAGSTKRKEKKFVYAIALLSVTASIIRAEVALLLVGIIVLLFYKESSPPSNTGISSGGNKATLPLSRKYRLTVIAVQTTIVAGIIGTAASIAVDSYFWSAWLARRRQQQQVALDNSDLNTGALQHLLKVVGFGTHWIWPEAWGLLYNVVEGKSSMWGTDVPMVRLPLAPPAETVARLSSARDHPANGKPERPKCGERVESDVAVSANGVGAGNEYVGAQDSSAFSADPHFRARYRWNGRRAHRPTVTFRLLLLALIGGLIGNTVVMSGLAYVSHHNYPGGKAMESLHRLHQARFDGLGGSRGVANETVRVFLPPGPRMTGASAYTFRYAPPFGHWEYNTTESSSMGFGTPEQLWQDGFDYVVTSMAEAESFLAAATRDEKRRAHWVLLDSVDAFGGVERRKGLVPLGIRWKREIAILGRD